MIINHKVKIDLVRRGITPKINVVQGDVYTRRLVITLLSDKRPWQVPEDAVTVIRYLKSDRSSGTYDTLADGTSAVSVSGNVISVLIAPEVLTLAGDVSLVVTLILGEQRLSTFEIDLWVQPNCSSSLLAATDTAWVAGFLPTPENASKGQQLVVDQVDKAGHVLALKTEDMPDIRKSVYAYAVEGGYTGTEEEFAKKLAQEFPKTVPSDWNAAKNKAGHVLNRTHWVENTSEDVIFDGVLDGKEYYYMAADQSQAIVKISDKVLTASDLIGRTVRANIAGQVYPFVLTESDITDYNAYGRPLCEAKLTIPNLGTTEAIFCVAQTVAMSGVTLSPGVYFGYMSANGMVLYVESLSGLTKTVEVIHKLDNKYIDAEWMATMLSDKKTILDRKTYSLNDLGGMAFAQIDPVALVAGAKYTIEYDGVIYERDCLGNDGTFVLGNLYHLNHGFADTGEPFVIYADANSGCSLCGAAGTHTMALYEGVDHPNKLPNKFIDAEWMATMRDGRALIYERDSDADGGIDDYGNLPGLERGATYDIEWGGVLYTDTARALSEALGVNPGDSITLPDGDEFGVSEGYLVWGDLSYYIGGEPTFPFSVEDLDETTANNTWLYNMSGEDGVRHVKIYKHEKVPNKLPEEFLPESVALLPEGGVVGQFLARGKEGSLVWIDPSSTATYSNAEEVAF